MRRIIYHKFGYEFTKDNIKYRVLGYYPGLHAEDYMRPDDKRFCLCVKKKEGEWMDTCYFYSEEIPSPKHK